MIWLFSEAPLELSSVSLKYLSLIGGELARGVVKSMGLLSFAATSFVNIGYSLMAVFPESVLLEYQPLDCPLLAWHSPLHPWMLFLPLLPSFFLVSWPFAYTS